MHLLALLALLIASPFPCARAHVDTDSTARLRQEGGELRITLEVDTDRLMEATQAPPPLATDWSESEVDAMGAAAASYLNGHWQLELDGKGAVLRITGWQPIRGIDSLTGQERMVRVAFELVADRPAGDLHAQLVPTLFPDLESNHRHTLVVDTGEGRAREFAVSPGVPCRFELPDRGSGAAWRRGWKNALGAATSSLPEQAKNGIGAFLLALMLAPLSLKLRWRSVGACVLAAGSAFAAARLDWIAPAAWAAAAAAALSVAYVSVENLVTRPARPLGYRTTTALLFGLVHGMGLETRLHANPAIATEGAGAAAGFFAGAVGVALLIALVAGATPLVATLPAPRLTFAARLLAAVLVVMGALGLFFALRNRGT